MFGKSKINSYQNGYDDAYMEDSNLNPYNKELDLDLWLDYENGYRDGSEDLEKDSK